MALNSRCKSCRALLGPEDSDGPNTQPEECAGCRANAAAARVHPREALGRQQKAVAMVGVIDANFHRQFPRLDAFDQALRIRDASFTWSDEQWERIGEDAGYARKPISRETRDAVRAIYAARAKAPLADRRAS